MVQEMEQEVGHRLELKAQLETESQKRQQAIKVEGDLRNRGLLELRNSVEELLIERNEQFRQEIKDISQVEMARHTSTLRALGQRVEELGSEVATLKEERREMTVSAEKGESVVATQEGLEAVRTKLDSLTDRTSGWEKLSLEVAALEAKTKFTRNEQQEDLEYLHELQEAMTEHKELVAKSLRTLEERIKGMELTNAPSELRAMVATLAQEAKLELVDGQLKQRLGVEPAYQASRVPETRVVRRQLADPQASRWDEASRQKVQIGSPRAASPAVRALPSLQVHLRPTVQRLASASVQGRSLSPQRSVQSMQVQKSWEARQLSPSPTRTKYSPPRSPSPVRTTLAPLPIDARKPGFFEDHCGAVAS